MLLVLEEPMDKTFTIIRRWRLLPMWFILNKLEFVDRAALKFLDTAVWPIFASITNAVPEFFFTKAANSSPGLAELLFKFPESLPSASACIVFSVTSIEFFSVTLTHLPINSFRPVLVVTTSIPIELLYCHALGEFELILNFAWDIFRKKLKKREFVFVPRF